MGICRRAVFISQQQKVISDPIAGAFVIFRPLGRSFNVGGEGGRSVLSGT